MADSIGFADLLQMATPAICMEISRYNLNAYGYDKDDLFQIAALGLWQALDHYFPEVDIRAYARVIASRRLGEVWKSARRLKRNIKKEEGIVDETFLSRGVNPLDALIRKENATLYFDCLTELERKCLTALSQGCRSYNVIAAENNISRKAVSNAIDRAKRKLREARYRATGSYGEVI